MSMIFFACVVRVRDGLPLSASTDFHFNQDFLECRKRLKALSSILAQYPSRGTAKGRDLNIHFLSSGDIACMAICSSNYSTIMAFCFLEELQWEFAASYDTTSISLASRPYAFLEFDNVIQKVKCHFNCASASRTKANWEKIEEELKFRPPVQLKLEDTELMNGMTNGGHAGVHVEFIYSSQELATPGQEAEDPESWGDFLRAHSFSPVSMNVGAGEDLDLVSELQITLLIVMLTAFYLWLCKDREGMARNAIPTYRMQRVTPLGILSLVLNIMCGALNLIRGVHLAEYSFQEDHEGIGNVIAFFLPFLACVFQCYLYLFYSSARKVKTFVLFFSVCLCNVYLYGLRNLWQIAFHIGVASLSSYQILTRQLMEKQPDCGV